MGYSAVLNSPSFSAGNRRANSATSSAVDKSAAVLGGTSPRAVGRGVAVVASDEFVVGRDHHGEEVPLVSGSVASVLSAAGWIPGASPKCADLGPGTGHSEVAFAALYKWTLFPVF